MQPAKGPMTGTTRRETVAAMMNCMLKIEREIFIGIIEKMDKIRRYK